MKQTQTYIVWFLGLVFVLVILLGAWYQETFQTHDMSLSFLDVGQGDAIFLQTPDGVQVLIDGGPKDAVLSKLKRVMPRGDRTIDMLVITNPDSDHFSGFSRILDEYTVKAVLVSGTRSTTPEYKALMQKIERKKIPQIGAYRDMVMTLGSDARLEVLFPDQVVRGWERNDGSIVMRFLYKNTSVMLMGDATSETEVLIMGTKGQEALGSQILKLGHHGSRTSTSEAWLDLVSPSVAIVSSGKNNRYGHPHEEVMTRLEERGVQVFNTALDGTVSFVSNGAEWVLGE